MTGCSSAWGSYGGGKSTHGLCAAQRAMIPSAPLSSASRGTSESPELIAACVSTRLLHRLGHRPRRLYVLQLLIPLQAKQAGLVLWSADFTQSLFMCRPAHDTDWWVMCHAEGPLLLSHPRGNASGALHEPRLRLGCRQERGEASEQLEQRMRQHAMLDGFLLNRAEYDGSDSNVCADAPATVDHPVFFLIRWDSYSILILLHASPRLRLHWRCGDGRPDHSQGADACACLLIAHLPKLCATAQRHSSTTLCCFRPNVLSS